MNIILEEQEIVINTARIDNLVQFYCIDST